MLGNPDDRQFLSDEHGLVYSGRVARAEKVAWGRNTTGTEEEAPPMAMFEAGGFIAHLRPAPYVERYTLGYEVDHLIHAAGDIRVAEVRAETVGPGPELSKVGSAVVLRLPLSSLDGGKNDSEASINFAIEYETTEMAGKRHRQWGEALRMVDYGYAVFA